VTAPFWAWLAALLAAGMTVGAGLLVWRLRRSRQVAAQYAAVLDALPEACQITTRDGRVVHGNTAAAALAGDSTTALPAALAARGDPGTAGRLWTLAPPEPSAAGSVTLPLTLPASEAGPGIEARLTGRGLPGGLCLWHLADVTAARRLEAQEQAELARLSALLDPVPLGFLAVDDTGRLLAVNATLAEWLGREPARLAAEDWRLHDLAPTAAAAGALPESPFAGTPATAPDGVRHGETTFRDADGQDLTLRISQVTVEGGAGGRTTRMILRNVGRERRETAALRRSERRLRRLFDSAPVGIGFLDRTGRVSEANPAFQTLLLGRLAEPRGERLTELVRADDWDAVVRTLNGTAGAGEDPPQVHGIESERVCTVFTRAFDDEPGEAHQIVYLIDATEQKKLEIQFVQSMKMQAVGQLAGGVAHDFNNLLTAMIGFCDLLLLRHRPGDQSFADLMQIKQNANRAAGLVRQLLAFSRQQTLRPSVLSLTDVLAELKHLLGRLLGETISLEMSHGRDLYPVKVDQGQFEQVVINLAVNARDAMAAEGGHLAIRTSNLTLSRPLVGESEQVPPGDYVLIEIADTGTGIPKAHLDRIFEPFFSTKEFGAGTGLGLSTVYGIVKQTGGFILVDSEMGAGTSFRIYLPRYHETEGEGRAASSDPEVARDLTGAGTILLVEDEDAVRTFAARALRKKGYSVLEAGSGEQALEVIGEAETGAVDLLITDVIMPQLDGPTLAVRLREQQPGLKVIFISGYTEDSFRQQLDTAEDVHFLSKPFNLRDLAGTVKEVLASGGG